VDISILCTTKESMIDTKKTKLNDLFPTRIAITHVTIEKAKAEAWKIKILRKHIAILENHVN
jgi:hypothetical protein